MTKTLTYEKGANSFFDRINMTGKSQIYRLQVDSHDDILSILSENTNMSPNNETEY